MKLAEALALRAEYQNKIDALHQRILTNLKVQEGDEPLEPPLELLTELFMLNEELCRLVQTINRQNNATLLPGGEPLCDALIRRDMLAKKRNLLNSIAREAMGQNFRVSRSEIKYLTTIDVPKLQEQIDQTCKAWRELDTLIQSVNWTTDLDEELR